MTGWQEYVELILTILVGIIVIKIFYIEKINDLLDYFGISTIEFKKEIKYSDYTPIHTSALKNTCEDNIGGNIIVWDRLYDEYGYLYKKSTTEIMLEHMMKEREQHIANNYTYEKEENKMTNRQLKDKIEDLNHEIKRKNEEIDILKDKGNKTEIIVATREDIDEAKCCKTCKAFQPAFYIAGARCEKKIITDYEDVNIKESKCRYYIRNEEKLLNMLREIREINEHNDRIKKAEPKIIKL